MLSTLRRIDGNEPQALGSNPLGSGAARFSCCALVGDNADPALLIERHRRVLADVWPEHIRITNHSEAHAVLHAVPTPRDAGPGPGLWRWAVALPSQTNWEVHLSLVPGGSAVRTRPRDDRFFAAGTPWFLTLFGRDSLWSALMSLLLGSAGAGETLRVLARHQGERHDDITGHRPVAADHDAVLFAPHVGIRMVRDGAAAAQGAAGEAYQGPHFEGADGDDGQAVPAGRARDHVERARREEGVAIGRRWSGDGGDRNGAAMC